MQFAVSSFSTIGKIHYFGVKLKLFFIERAFNVL